MAYRAPPDRINGEVAVQIMEAVFTKEALNSAFGYQVEQIRELTSNMEKGTHILLATPKQSLKDGLKETKYLVHIRQTGLTEENILELEYGARLALKSLVPTRVHSGSFFNDLLGLCTYVLYTLEDTEDEVFSLSQVWNDMSSIQRNSMISQVMDCRSKLRKITIEKDWPGKWPAKEYERKIPQSARGGEGGLRVSHPAFYWKAKEPGRQDCLATRSRRHNPSLWKIDSELDMWWEDLPSLLTLLEPFVADQGAVLLPIKTQECLEIRIRPDDASITPTIFSFMQARWAAAAGISSLQHCGLKPENILVTKHRRPCMPAKYRIFSIVGWHEALYAPPGYDICFHDARLGSREGGDQEDGSFYEKFRPLAMSSAFLKKADTDKRRWPVRQLVEIIHNLAEHKELARPASAPRDGLNPFPRRTGWLADNHFVWMGAEKGYVRRDPLV